MSDLQKNGTLYALIKIYFKILKVLEWIAKVFLVIDIFAMIALMTMQIINRYLFKNTFTWTEELARYFFIWGTVMGAAVALRRYELVGVSFIMEKFEHKPRLYKALQTISFASITVFFGFFTRYGYKLMVTAIKGNVLSAALQVPMATIYSVFPIGGAFLVLFSIACIIEVYIGRQSVIEPEEE